VKEQFQFGLPDSLSFYSVFAVVKQFEVLLTTFAVEEIKCSQCMSVLPVSLHLGVWDISLRGLVIVKDRDADRLLGQEVPPKLTRKRNQVTTARVVGLHTEKQVQRIIRSGGSSLGDTILGRATRDRLRSSTTQRISNQDGSKQQQRADSR
jgi:hypothetical protein